LAQPTVLQKNLFAPTAHFIPLIPGHKFIKTIKCKKTVSVTVAWLAERGKKSEIMALVRYYRLHGKIVAYF
jgi:hypothetical protein